jgi:hypothetical protein
MAEADLDLITACLGDIVEALRALAINRGE